MADVIGETSSWREGQELCRRSGAQVIITDLAFTSQEDGIRLCRQVKKLPEPPQVMVFSNTNDAASIAACIVNGVDSFVHRSASAAGFIEAVRALLDQRPVWSIGVQPNEADQSQSPEEHLPSGILTTRETDVLELVFRRYSNAEIAADLNLAHQTVKNYVSNILQKLGVSSRRELFSRGFEQVSPIRDREPSCGCASSSGGNLARRYVPVAG